MPWMMNDKAIILLNMSVFEKEKTLYFLGYHVLHVYVCIF